MKKMKKIAYVSGTRADFGIMSSILKAVEESPNLKLQMYITGIHLTPGFGLGITDKEVYTAFPRTRPIDCVFDLDNFLGVAGFLGKFLSELVKVFSQDRPDFVLILGDRPEEHCVATACLYLGIPTGHFRGGEVSSTFDEIARHSITKLSSLHFAATKDAAKRIERLGEEKNRIYVVGEASLDVILNQKLPDREELFKALNLISDQNFILLTQHPVSYELADAGRQIKETIAAVKQFNLPVVAIYPHADAGGRKIIYEIDKEKNNPLFRIYSSLSYKMFLTAEREAVIWVGNSSGALCESSSFGTPVVNIGTRQDKRFRGGNVMDAGYNRREIVEAMKKSMKPSYLARLKKLKNPWGDGKTGQRVVKILESLEIDDKLLAKKITF